MIENEKENFVVSSSGTKYYTPIEYVYDEGCKTYVPKEGKKLNRFEMIQASAPSCDINVIMKRAMAGDVTILTAMEKGANFEGNYSDISEIPDNINDINQLNVQAMNSFYQMDPNIRKLFDNDYTKFAEAYSNGTWVDVIKNAMNVPTDNSNTEVKEGAE